MQNKITNRLTAKGGGAALRGLCVALVLFVAGTAQAQMKYSQRYAEYIERYAPTAVEQMNRYGVPASITLAQGLLESGAGYSALATRGNNHFGIKCHDWTGAKQYHDDDERGECFRVYASAAESFEDHSRFLATKQRYASLFNLARTDYKGWANGLKAAGYATNPIYAQKLIEIIELYGLSAYDSGKTPKAKNNPTTTAIVPPATNTTTNLQARSAYEIRKNNGKHYVLAHEGDTFKTLAQATGVKRSKLANYNERDKRDVLSENDIVYLEKKATRAHKSLKNKPYTVKAGDSMYSIAQRHGIQLKALYKKNKLSADYAPQVGDTLKVY